MLETLLRYAGDPVTLRRYAGDPVTLGTLLHAALETRNDYAGNKHLLSLLVSMNSEYYAFLKKISQ